MGTGSGVGGGVCFGRGTGGVGDGSGLGDDVGLADGVGLGVGEACTLNSKRAAVAA